MKQYSSIKILTAIIFFYSLWGISQLLNIKVENSILPHILFSIIFTGIAGCLIPIMLKNTYEWTYDRTDSKNILGLFFLVFTVIFGTIFSGAIFQVIKLHYSLGMVIKYVLLFFPMSLAISLFAFLVIPNLIDGWTNKKSKAILLVSSIALFFFISFLIDSLFTDMSFAGIMGLLGLLFGISYIFLRNFWIIYLGFFITMLINTLAENKHDEYQYWIVILSTLLSLLILLYDYLKNKGKSHNKANSADAKNRAAD